MSRRAVAALAATALALVAVGALVLGRDFDGSATDAVAPRVSDCARLELPRLANRELDTNLDLQRRLLTISVRDEQRGENRTFTIAYESPSCLARPELKRVIDHVLATARSGG